MDYGLRDSGESDKVAKWQSSKVKRPARGGQLETRNAKLFLLAEC